MFWIRRVLIGILGIVLIISLFSLSLGTGFNSAFSSSNHLKTWAKSSDFYSSLISKASSDTAASLNNPKLFSQLNPVIKQDLMNVFPESQFNGDIDTIINSNYAWLEGQTSAPNFTIDVTSEKTAFASELGSFVQNQYTSLPKCNLSQIANLSTTNPLDLSCQVPTISPSQVKAAIVSDVKSSNIIVKNTVITPSSYKRNNGKPYYTAVNAPTAYRHLKYEPIGAAIIALIAIAGIAFLTLRKRIALAILGFCFALTGLILLAVSTSTVKIDSRVSTALAKHTNLSSFETPVNNLIHKVVAYINSVNLWFAVGYLLIALILISLFLFKRRRKPSSQTQLAQNVNDEQIETNRGIEQPDLTRHHARVQPTAPEIKSNKNNRRLIQ